MRGPLLRRISDGRTAPRDERLGSRGHGEASLRRVAVHPACRIVRLSGSLDADLREPGAVHREVRTRDRPRALRVQGPRGQGPRAPPRVHGVDPPLLRVEPPKPAETAETVYGRERLPLPGAPEGPVPRV